MMRPVHWHRAFARPWKSNSCDENCDLPLNTKKVTLTVDVVVEIEDDVEPNDVTFDIDLEKIRPMISNKYVGRTLGYCTQEYVGE